MRGRKSYVYTPDILLTISVLSGIIFSKFYSFTSGCIFEATFLVLGDWHRFPHRVVTAPNGYKSTDWDKCPVSYTSIKVETPIALQKWTDLWIYEAKVKKKKVDEPFRDIYATQSFNWLIYKDTVAMPWGGIYYNGMTYYWNAEWQGLYGGGPETPTNFTEYQFHIVFNFAHGGTPYGHFLIDYLPVVMMISPELRQHAYFIARTMHPFLKRTLPWAGVPLEHVIPMEPDMMIRGEKLYMCNPLMMQTMNAMMLLKMREMIARKLDLGKEKPWRYVIYNRKKTRKILNIDSVLDHVHTKFPDITFDYYRDDPLIELPEEKKWAEQYYWYDQIMFVWSVHGSGLLNCMFMQANTVFAVLETQNSWGKIFILIGKLFLKHTYIARDWSYFHWRSGHNIPFEKYRVWDSIDLAINKAIEVQKTWKPMDIPCPAQVPMLQWDDTIKYS